MKFNYLKASFLIGFVFLGLFLGLRAEAYSWQISVSNPPAIAGQPVNFVLRITPHPLDLAIRICVPSFDFGDWTEISGDSCWITSFTSCSINFTHTYASPGNYTYVYQVCDCSFAWPFPDPAFCRSSSGTITVEPASVGVGFGIPDLNPLRYGLFGELIEGIFVVLFWAAIVLAPTLIVAGGLIMLFAGANPNNIVLGKKIILYTVVIFVIVLILRAMIAYFKGDLTFH